MHDAINSMTNHMMMAANNWKQIYVNDAKYVYNDYCSEGQKIIVYILRFCLYNNSYGLDM